MPHAPKGKKPNKFDKYNAEGRKIGHELARITAIKHSPLKAKLAPANGKRVDFFTRFKSSEQELNRFDSRYRSLAAGQDELIPTSLMREIYRGIVRSQYFDPKDSQQVESLNSLLNDISEVRIPTKYAGFSLKSGLMQHPTGRKPFFAKKSDGEALSQHAMFDDQRKRQVITAMNQAIARHDSAAEIVYSGLREAITFTLNEFTAPVLAKDVFKYSNAKQQKATLLLGQIRARERVKQLQLRIGGRMEQSSDARVNRIWRKDKSQPGKRRRLKRTVSFNRLDTSTLAHDLAVKQSKALPLEGAMAVE